MSEQKTVLDEVKEILDYYYENSQDIIIEDLLRMQDKVAILGYRLAEELAEIRKQYNWAYFTRKIEFNKAKSHYIGERQMKIGESDVEAHLDVEQQQKKELEFENMGYQLENVLRQLNKVLSAVQQRISYLKFEKQRTQNQNTT